MPRGSGSRPQVQLRHAPLPRSPTRPRELLSEPLAGREGEKGLRGWVHGAAGAAVWGGGG